MLLALALALHAPAFAFETTDTAHLEIKWVRDSAEYQALTRQIYKDAGASVRDQAAHLKKRTVWTVVLDVDDTTLDTSEYMLDRAAYRLRFDWPSWDAWTERRDAPPVPGVVKFIEGVRAEGGRVAWITNRHPGTRQATIDDLANNGLWSDSDVMCTLSDDDAYTKKVRRTELRSGKGPCAWDGTPVTVLAYLGDAMHDLPEDGEDGAAAENLGVRTFVIPNPMYGGFDHAVTRALP